MSPNPVKKAKEAVKKVTAKKSSAKGKETAGDEVTARGAKKSTAAKESGKGSPGVSKASARSTGKAAAGGSAGKAAAGSKAGGSAGSPALAKKTIPAKPGAKNTGVSPSAKKASATGKTTMYKAPAKKASKSTKK